MGSSDPLAIAARTDRQRGDPVGPTIDREQQPRRLRPRETDRRRPVRAHESDEADACRETAPDELDGRVDLGEVAVDRRGEQRA